jgi:hypothetical protein
MRRGPSKSTVVAAALCLAVLAPAGSDARKPAKAVQAPPPNADQQLVVARIVDETFPRPKHEPFTLALCLDVQIAPAADEDAPPAFALAKRDAKKRGRATKTALPPLPILRGAPPELVARLARPWRLVASASSCRLDPRQPIALPDQPHTTAQLVTVHLAPDVAVGTIKIDWTDGHDLTAGASRDCTAARGPRGWDVHCGGTWFQ